ncbi:MAG: proline dehydrogenase family protein [Acidimicrobiia bacterium]
MIRSAVLAVTDRTVTRKLITDTRAGRAVADRFVAGDTLDSAVAVAVELNDAGMSVSLDHLGEHVLDMAEAERATATYLACLDQIATAGIDSNISIKLTQLGLGLDNDAAASHLDALARAASSSGTTVTVDMEESEHTDATVDMYAAAQKRHGNLGIAIQSYLHRSADDLDKLIPLGGHIRLCKGAYAEPNSIAYQGSDVDASYDRLGSLLMNSSGVKPAIATHDDDRLGRILDLASHRKQPWEFQMLYGVRRDRQADLVADGYQVRVYVPYGAAWYPYLTRRMAERPANMMFFARALVGG